MRDFEKTLVDDKMITQKLPCQCTLVLKQSYESDVSFILKFDQHTRIYFFIQMVFPKIK